MPSTPSDRDTDANRRRFLQYLAASPMMAAGGASAFAETILPRVETHAMMQQVGAPSIKQLVPAMVRRA